MATPTGRWADPQFRKVYLQVVSNLAESMCAPFWWSLARPGDRDATILHNGTICYINTGIRSIGVTANHVYQQYLKDLEEHGEKAIECQFGSSTIYPEKHAIHQSSRWDIATFDIPQVFVDGSVRNRKTQHQALKWPPARAEKPQVVMYGGFPGSLREAKGSIAELPFQWVAGRFADISDESIVLEPDCATMKWQGPEKNDNPGDWSGGPVYRSVEDGPIARLEIVGFIYDFPFERAVRARHADVVLPDGTVR